jgi:hypothetical protein
MMFCILARLELGFYQDRVTDLLITVSSLRINGIKKNAQSWHLAC